MAGRSYSLFSTYATVGALMMVFVMSGCEDKRRHKASSGVDLALTGSQIADDASPLEVARALIQALEEFQNARRRGLGSEENRAELDRALARVQGLIAGKEILRDLIRGRLQSAFLPPDATEDAVVTLLAESWASIVANYVGGFRMETLQQIAADSNGSDVVVFAVQAESPRERELLDADTKEYAGREGRADLIRRSALEQGFNLPIDVEVQIKLRKRKDGPWRAVHVNLQPIKPVSSALPLRFGTPASTPPSAKAPSGSTATPTADGS